MHRDCPLDCKVYVGNLGNNGNKTELERAFGYYGPLRSVWVARNPPGFAFVEFEDARDANDSVRELDGREAFQEPWSSTFMEQATARRKASEPIGQAKIATQEKQQPKQEQIPFQRQETG
ncbi:hypothetical protein CRUP_005029 [Coryphaenoides rupestris]|nr:hypothetical protein CRUP_005029 [Coryphaenoides rupestris]